MGDAAAETGLFTELAIQMQGVEVARNAGEEDNVRLGYRSLKKRRHADIQIFNKIAMQFLVQIDGRGITGTDFGHAISIHGNKIVRRNINRINDRSQRAM